ncbi:MAG TPA: hypothetical protein VHL53_21000 [Acidimicrobiia bacterium]|nr:hypothetical protein [Acidimicrobiia bacterium]
MVALACAAGLVPLTLAAPPAGALPAGPVPGAPTATDGGTWLAASDGGVFSFGGAPFYGSMGGQPLNRPIVTMAATPSGRGYWLVASDGGVFAFGDAGWFGSTGGQRLDRPVVSMARTVTGNGYWLVAADGGVFTFGDAVFRGRIGGPAGARLEAPIVGIAPTPGGRGYWLAAADGGVFTFGDAPFAGSAGGLPLAQPVVAVAAAPRGLGYWLVGGDGGVFSYGAAPFAGSLGGLKLVAPIVTLAPRPVIERAETSIFYYPWYSVPGVDLRAGWRHWEQNGHTPPSDIGANFYPAGGLYSSLDATVLARQARQIAAAGVDTVVSSWWGRGAYEDWMLPDLVKTMGSAGLRLAIHLEPYKGRTAATVASDLAYLRGLGITEVYLYQADTAGAAADWAPVIAAHPDMRFFAETGDLAAMLSGAFADYAAAAGFDGVYSYDAVRYGAAEMEATCGAARQRRLLCAPSVAPGFDARRSGSPQLGVTPAAAGARYDALWSGAFAAGADVVSITSWNEWHEGTQIEPAVPFCFPSDGYCSPGYEGVYGRTGVAAQTGYLDRTLEWSNQFRALRSAG